MYRRFYGLRERPFSLLPDPTFLYPSEKHQTALELLEYSLMNQAGFCVLSGDIGTGKTTLIRTLLAQLGKNVTVGLISNTHRSLGELLQWVLMAYGLDFTGKDKAAMHHAFVNFVIGEYAKNRRTLLIIDEAQNLSAGTLEELRMLSNINADKDQVLQVFLVGQPGLRDVLLRPDLEQFAQRIVVDYHLEPLDEIETAGYIRHRLTVAGGDAALFDDGACAAIFRYSRGVARLINLLADTALVFGYGARASHIGANLIEEVAQAKRKSGIFPGTRPDADVSAKGASLAKHEAPVNPGHEGKKKLRVALVSDAEPHREVLKALLESYGMEVVATSGFDLELLPWLNPRAADVLLINLDDNIERKIEPLNDLLGQCHVPVLFNDGSETQPGRPGFDRLTQRLALKLAAIGTH